MKVPPGRDAEDGAVDQVVIYVREFPYPKTPFYTAGSSHSVSILCIFSWEEEGRLAEHNVGRVIRHLLWHVSERKGQWDNLRHSHITITQRRCQLQLTFLEGGIGSESLYAMAFTAAKNRTSETVDNSSYMPDLSLESRIEVVMMDCFRGRPIHPGTQSARLAGPLFSV